ncbi:MAG: HAD-IA family hydrolase [Myxococcales bacterium]|nr:HAD-IA family hydrolase [Myxococcales bacterium]
MAVRCVIFDFDGTMADSFDVALSIANRIAPEYGYRPALPDEVDRLRTCSYPELARELGVKTHKIPFIAARVRKEMQQVAGALRPTAGLPAVLEQLHTRGYSLGVFSSNSRRNVEIFLRENGLESFDFISTASNVWGKQRHLRSLMRRRGLSHNEVIYVGDETRDIDACRALRVPVIAVSWGYTAASRLQLHEPSFLIDEPTQLLSILSSPS